MRWRAALIVVAVGAAVAPLPPAWVERWYSLSVYPRIQAMLTPVSNLAPFALFDVLIATAVAVLLLPLLFDFRKRRHNLRGILGRLLLRTAVLGASLYVVFLLVWGLNYRRRALIDKLQFDGRAVSAETAVAAALTNVEQLNALYERAHAMGWRPLGEIDPALETALGRVTRDLGGKMTAVPGRPKVTILDPYFRRAGVEGMIDPYFLETLVQREILPFERSFVVAHEWSHLAGFADESEANFVGWLTCLRGSVAHQYSGWLFLYGELARAVPGRERGALSAMLTSGPRADLNAIVARYRQQVSPKISAVGWRVYDQYLKANRIPAGAASYDEVVRLVLGVRFGPDWTPLRR